MNSKEIANLLKQIQIIKPYKYEEVPEKQVGEDIDEFIERENDWKKRNGLMFSLLEPLNYDIAIKALNKISQDDILLEQFNKNAITTLARETRKLTANFMEEQGKMIATKNGEVYLLIEKYKTISIPQTEEDKKNNIEKIDIEYIMFLEDAGNKQIYSINGDFTNIKKEYLFIKIKESKKNKLNKINKENFNATKYKYNEVLNAGKKMNYWEVLNEYS